MSIGYNELLKISRTVDQSILSVLKYYSSNLALGGESIRAILMGEEVKEFDIYIKDNQDITPEDVIDYLKEWEQVLPYKLKFVVREFADIHSLIDGMDYTIDSAALMYNNGTWSIYCHDDFFKDNAMKIITCAEVGGVSSLMKAIGYIKKGYTVNNVELSEILAEVVSSSGIDYEDSKESISDTYLELLEIINPDYE